MSVTGSLKSTAKQQFYQPVKPIVMDSILYFLTMLYNMLHYMYQKGVKVHTNQLTLGEIFGISKNTSFRVLNQLLLMM